MQVENFLNNFNEQIKRLKGASTNAQRIVVTFNMYNKKSISVPQTESGKWQTTPAVEDDCFVIQEPYSGVNEGINNGEVTQSINGSVHRICIPNISDIEFNFVIEKLDLIEKLVAPSA